jgi:galactokinase
MPIFAAQETTVVDHATRQLDQLAARARAQFVERFGRAARWLAAAPGRVNLIGEHIDYNDGFVLPMAIERHVVIAADASSNAPPRWRIASAGQAAAAEVHVDQPITRGEPAWTNYVRGVAAGFQRRGVRLPGMDLLIDSNLPMGGGLSSSAALEVATATLLEAVTNQQISPVDKALLCQKAEQDFAGVPCGIMDQFASVMARRGRLLLIDCRSRQVEQVPLGDDHVSVLIINSGVRHELAGGEYARRRAQCEQAAAALELPSLRDATLEQLESVRGRIDDVVYRRARHVITEIARTVAAAAALKRGDWPAVGDLMYASHASLRDDYQVSCDELDTLVAIARQIGRAGGVLGGRMTGGGFGGCAVCLVETAKAEQVSERIAAAYQQRTGIKTNPFSTQPAEGAGMLERMEASM